MMKKAFITGITGQDGRLLSKLLLNKQYEVHGMKRYVSGVRNIDLDPRIYIYNGDMTDEGSILSIIQKIMPDEIYNLAAMSNVYESFCVPEYVHNVNSLGLIRILNAVQKLNLQARIYQASTSEMFGATPPPQNELSDFRPRSPYANSKLCAYHTAVNYRESYDMYISNGILFNHESILRGHEFVTRKITRTLARIKLGLQDCLYLGHLDAERDWGHASDYINAQWLILQQPQPGDYVIATGVSRTVRDFAALAANYIGMDLKWCGRGITEYAVDRKTGKTVIRVDPQLFRPSEPESLCGDATKAYTILNWQPNISFEDLVLEMVEYDLMEAELER